MYQAGLWRSLLSVLFLATWSLLHGLSCVTSSGGTTRQGLSWEARRGQQVVTLMGTMHVGVHPDEIPKGLWARLEAADTVVTEVDLAGMNGSLVQRFLVLPASQNLQNMLGASDWQRFRATVQEAFPQTTEAQLQRMTPLAACSHLMLAEAELAQKAEAQAGEATPSVRDQVSLDQHIMEVSRAKGKTLRTFETLEEQFSFLDKVFTVEQLREMLAESAENRRYYTELARSFKAGDSTSIDEMIAMMPAHLRETLLDQRNKHWGRKMQAMLSPNNTFMAVGAAHLGGQTGLLSILEAQGFQLSPLKFQEANHETR